MVGPVCVSNYTSLRVEWQDIFARSCSTNRLCVRVRWQYIEAVDMRIFF